ncbi:unnamed protein product [Symbiodinium sp. CCMP2456]|nr:unnamed protein product [Symbiodinium sp. CCMP2456]
MAVSDMRAHIERAIGALPSPASIDDMHTQLDGVLTSACEQFFPRGSGRAQQLANSYPTLAALDAALQVGFKQLWQLRRSMQQHAANSRGTSNAMVWARYCFTAWAQQAKYHTMSKLFHKRSRRRKQARWNDIADKVSAADERGDSHAKHAALKQLQPWAIFAVHDETAPARHLTANVSPTDAELHNALARTGPHWVCPLLRALPQYAYSAKHSSLDALPRVNSHFWRVQEQVQGTRLSIYQRKAGVANPQCYGGITLSVDLKGAFNEVPRNLLYQCLEQLGVDEDTMILVRQLHWEATYWLRNASGGVGVVTSNGIKQGCRVAPTLWNCYTVTLLQTLCQQLGNEHLRQCLTLFADDLISTKEYRSWEEALVSIHCLKVVLTTLEQMGTVINFDKTAVLLSANGTLARKLRRHLTVKVKGKLCVVLRVSDREVCIPLVASHVYLGTVISYKQAADKTVRHRMQVAGHKWQKLKRALRCRHMLTRGKRTQIWSAGVRSSMLYGLASVQFGANSRQALRSKVARQLRHIAHLPAHVTGINNQELHAMMRALDPVTIVRETLEARLKHLEVVEQETPDDVVCCPSTLEYARALLEFHKQHESQEHNTARIVIAEPTVGFEHACPECGLYFASASAVKQHCTLAHDITAAPMEMTHAEIDAPSAVTVASTAATEDASHRRFLAQSCALCGQWATNARLSAQDVLFRAVPSSTVAPRTQGLPKLAMTLADRMRAEEMEIFGNTSQGLLFGPKQEVLTEEFSTGGGKRRRQQEQGGGKSKGKGKGGLRTGESSLREAVESLTRVVMAHEDSLNHSKLDRGMVFYMGTGEDSIVRKLFAITQKAKEVRQQGSASQAPLKILLLKSMLAAIDERMTVLDKNPDALDKATKAQLLTEQGWTFKRWDHQAKQLVVDDTKVPINAQDMRKILQEIFELIHEDTILKFASHRGLKEDHVDDKTAVFLMEISVRGEKADRLFFLFARLAHSSVWHTLGSQMRRATLRRSGLAQRVARDIFGWS